MKTIAVINRKGGVGKTSCTLNLARELERLGLLVLLLDLDAQTDLSRFLGMPLQQESPRNHKDILAVLRSRVDISDAAQLVTGTSTLYAVPGSKRIEEFDFQYSQQVLRDRLQDPGLCEVDVVLIDCPPALNQAVYCGLHASDYALLVTEPELPSMDHLQDSLDVIQSVSKAKQGGLEPLGILVNRVDLRRSITRKNIASLRAKYPDLLLSSTISVDTAIVNSYHRKQFVRDFPHTTRSARQFSGAATELMQRLGLSSTEGREASNE